MKEYEINDATLAIIPNGKKSSTIMEDDFQYQVDDTTLGIINYSCKYFGSSYNGRRDGAQEILSSGYKLPILIEDSQNLVFLPTNSPQNKDCVWLALNKIRTINKVPDDHEHVIIEFNNNKTLKVSGSYHSIQNQILRASRLESIIRNRKQEKVL